MVMNLARLLAQGQARTAIGRDSAGVWQAIFAGSWARFMIFYFSKAVLSGIDRI
jgi:hypothetical protein